MPKVSEWLKTVEVLKQLPPERELPQLMPVECEGCLRWEMASGRDANGDWWVDGWRQRDDMRSINVCSRTCAEAVTQLTVRAGGARPLWRVTLSSEV